MSSRGEHPPVPCCAHSRVDSAAYCPDCGCTIIDPAVLRVMRLVLREAITAPDDGGDKPTDADRALTAGAWKRLAEQEKVRADAAEAKADDLRDTHARLLVTVRTLEAKIEAVRAARMFKNIDGAQYVFRSDLDRALSDAGKPCACRGALHASNINHRPDGCVEGDRGKTYPVERRTGDRRVHDLDYKGPYRRIGIADRRKPDAAGKGAGGTCPHGTNKRRDCPDCDDIGKVAGEVALNDPERCKHGVWLGDTCFSCYPLAPVGDEALYVGDFLGNYTLTLTSKDGKPIPEYIKAMTVKWAEKVSGDEPWPGLYRTRRGGETPIFHADAMAEALREVTGQASSLPLADAPDKIRAWWEQKAHQIVAAYLVAVATRGGRG